MIKVPHGTEWLDIPGYDGMYQISRFGEVRSWRTRGGSRAKAPKQLNPYVRKQGRISRAEFVKLTDSQGRGRDVKVLQLMANVWLGGCPDGMVPYHKNGYLDDHRAANIGFTTRQKLGQMAGGAGGRRPVRKVTPDGEVVEFYPSARTAAKANHMSYQTVMDRCNRKVKNPFALDGHNYQWDDEEKVGRSPKVKNV